MKKLILLLFIPLVFTCSDDSTDNNSSSSNSYLGTYIGDIDVFLQGQYHSTLYNHVMSFISIENSNNILIDGNLIMTNICTIEGNNLIISENTAASTSSFYVIEYGSGLFNGNELEIEFHQDQYNINGNINATGTWIGSLTKSD